MGASCRGAIEPEPESPLGHDFNSMGWKAFGAKLENWDHCLTGLQGLGMPGDMLGRLSSHESFALLRTFTYILLT